MKPANGRFPASRGGRRGYTLIEVIVVLAILGVLMAIPAPIFLRAVERARLDVAAANLRAIWYAQRFYYLENGLYADTMADLAPESPDGLPLIDRALASGETFYQYAITSGGDGRSYTVVATHPDVSVRFTGRLTIDQDGVLVSQVFDNRVSPTDPMTPSLEPR